MLQLMPASTIGDVMNELSYSENFVVEKLHQFSESKKKFYTEEHTFFMHSLSQEQPGQYGKCRVVFDRLEKYVTNWKYWQDLYPDPHHSIL